MKFSIKCRETKSGNEYYLQCGSGSSPNRTVLSTNFSWVKQDLRTKFEDQELALKWLVFLAKKIPQMKEMTFVREKE